ncbi:Cytochrome C oxidase subunit III [Candidatus Desulfarcum epimagneticum]|uniref:Cytochrome C oxidase subunit III n=1 Tax=uncultured Desulfobacteraceae bacterium TaxID=218296 RepID=A0A484HEA9_9BACT|nr:Cytochrome C oxidase subunit III [uncultured Desulfobacteraceae bacterium]
MTQAHDANGSKLGMWLFLFSEIMLFGGLFVLYAVYLAEFTPAFVSAGKELSAAMGTANTAILLISSFTAAASIPAIQSGSRKAALGFLGATLFMGAVFLVNKYIEWGAKFAAGVYPNSPGLAGGEPGRNIFFALYYTVTGLHGLHVAIGMILLAICLVMTARGKISAGRHAWLENSALYWHLVDLIWIFVFPLFYLIV